MNLAFGQGRTVIKFTRHMVSGMNKFANITLAGLGFATVLATSSVAYASDDAPQTYSTLAAIGERVSRRNGIYT